MYATAFGAGTADLLVLLIVVGGIIVGVARWKRNGGTLQVAMGKAMKFVCLVLALLLSGFLREIIDAIVFGTQSAAKTVAEFVASVVLIVLLVIAFGVSRVKPFSSFHGGPMDGQRLEGAGEPTCQFDAEFDGARGAVVYRRRPGPPELSGRERIHHMDYAGFTPSKPADSSRRKTT